MLARFRSTISLLTLLLVVLVSQRARAGAEAGAERPLVFGVNRVGGEGLLYRPPGYDEHVYQRVREAGGTCVRLLASPRDVERVRGQRDWSAFDRDLELALNYGQEPMVLICNTPAWASPTGEDTHLYPYKTELLPEFGDFCRDLAERTRGKVRFFQLWNEQNGCSWHFHDGFNHADEYLPVLDVCYKALKKANPECVLSLGSLDDAEGNAHYFMRKTYEEMRKQNVEPPVFDVVSDHPYSENSAIMRGKLDVLKKIMAAHGDSGMPFWITEYGWQTGHRDPEGQARRLAEVLQAFIRPEWSDVQAAIYLCIADFDGGEGFGLTDANLRPRPAFFAFQGASRFGAYPAHRIEPTFAKADELTITFKTLKPTKATVQLSASDDDSSPVRTTRTPEGTAHRVVFDGLAPGTDYRFIIETARQQDGEPKKISSAPHEIRTPAHEIHNEDFNDGFFGGIARGWRVEGTGLCTDAALIPFADLDKDQHAQAVFARGDKKHKQIDSTLSTIIAARPGERMIIGFDCAARSSDTTARLQVRTAIDAAARADWRSADLTWSPWRDLTDSWEHLSVLARPSNSVVRLLIQCRSQGAVGKGNLAFLVDNVNVR